MSKIRQFVRADITPVGDDEVDVIMSTGVIARDGHILVPSGVDLTKYRANPMVLWQHLPEEPVGRAMRVRVEGDKIVARIRFAPLGVSDVADRIRGLVKSGIITTVSVGFEPTEAEPLDPAKPRGGQRFTAWELLECSFVSVPADTGAVVTARAYGADAPNLETAPMPIANRSVTPFRKRALVAGVVKPKMRGLYDVASLAYHLMGLGYLHSDVVMEADMEQDGSVLPAMLGDALKKLGAALVEMTAEEVAELLADVADPEEAGEDANRDMRDDTLCDPEFEDCENERTRAWRRALLAVNRCWETRAGKVLSNANRSALLGIHGKISDVRSELRDFIYGTDTDVTDIQTSEGVADSDGAENGRGLSLDARRRRAAVLELSATD
jgi:HK97 family phage prohead protease